MHGGSFLFAFKMFFKGEFVDFVHFQNYVLLECRG